MKILFFDTETTGLPPKYSNLSADYDSYPYLVQVAWLVQDEHQYKLFEGNHIIRPVGYTIPSESVAIHKITNECAEKAGVSIKYVIKHLISDIQSADLIVGHNLDFDLDMIRANILKLKVDLSKIDKIINEKNKLCTMKATTNFCNLPSAYGDKPKFPKLEELHKILFNEEMLNAHDAWVDVAFTAKCYYELIKRKCIIQNTKENQLQMHKQ